MSNVTTWGDALDALANPYRRQLLVALLEDNPQDDDDRDPMNLDRATEEPEVLESELVHNHLPKLEDRGYIRWDRENEKISKGPNWDGIGPILELIHAHREELPDGWL